MTTTTEHRDSVGSAMTFCLCALSSRSPASVLGQCSPILRAICTLAFGPPSPPPPQTPPRLLVSTTENSMSAQTACDVSRDGTLIAVGSYNGCLTLWRVADLSLVRTIECRSNRWVSLSGDGSLIASATREGVRVFSVATGGQVASIPHGSYWVNGCAFAARGPVLWTVHEFGGLRAFDTRSWKETHSDTVADNGAGWGLSVSDCGSVVCATGRSQAYVCDVEGLHEGGSVPTVDQEGSASHCAVSQDGKLVAVTWSTGDVVVYDREAKRTKCVLRGQKKTVGAVFVPESRMVATSSDEDNSVRVWDRDTGKLLSQLPLPECPRMITASRYAIIVGLTNGRSNSLVAVWDIAPRADF